MYIKSIFYQIQKNFKCIPFTTHLKFSSGEKQPANGIIMVYSEKQLHIVVGRLTDNYEYVLSLPCRFTNVKFEVTNPFPKKEGKVKLKIHKYFKVVKNPKHFFRSL